MTAGHAARHSVPDESPEPPDQPTEVERAILIAALGRVKRPEVLSRTAMSVVYRARGADGRWFVVKILPVEVSDQAVQIADRFTGLGGVNQLVNSGSVGDHGFLVYKYAPGTLADTVERATRGRTTGISARGLAVTEVVTLLAPVAGALDRFAELDLVHADVKPANILIGKDGGAVLTDLERVVDAGTVGERATPGFCSPQQVSGAATGFADDRYGFAATVAGALVGDMTWTADPERELTRLLGPIARPLLMNLSAEPSERALTSSQLLDCVGWAQPAAATLAARASGPAAGPWPQLSVEPGAGLGVGLVAAAALIWGPSDLRAKTIERASLQLPAVAVGEAGESERSLWRRPATVVSIVAAVVAVVVGIVLLVR